MTTEMKDSGVKWIGAVPADWKINKIKYIAVLKGRIGWQGLTSDEYTDDGAYLITGVDFENGCINWDSCVHIPMRRWEEARDIRIEDGDLLITKDGTIGKVAIVSGCNAPTSLNSGVLRISTMDGYDRRFLYWVLQSDVFWTWFADKMLETAQSSISTREILLNSSTLFLQSMSRGLLLLFLTMSVPRSIASLTIWNGR